MEYLRIYDDNKNITSKVVKRGIKLNDREHILLSVIIIKTKDDKYLIQKVSKEKNGEYAFTGGHVLYNETSYECIVREVKEELGINIGNDKITYLTDIKIGIPFMDIYYLEKDIDLNDIKLQKEEVEEVFYLTEEEILKIIKQEKFRKSHSKVFNKYLDIARGVT